MQRSFWQALLLVGVAGAFVEPRAAFGASPAPSASPASPVAPLATAAIAPSSTASVSLASESPQKTELDRRKLQSEVDKLGAEIDKLKEETSPLGRFSNVASGVGGLAGAAVAFLIWLLGTRVKDAYETTQKEGVKAAKSRQDDRLARSAELNRDRHNLKLFGELANDNPRTQVAAAIVLLDRLAELRHIVIPSIAGEEPANEKKVTKADLEQQCIRSVLVAVLKKDPSNVKTRRAFFKTVAEGLARDLDALKEVGKSLPAESPLLPWDFQQAALAEVYWRFVDARGVDFFRADLCKAGLRDAHLEGTVFYGADLTDAVLRGAHLSRATNFELAVLHGADLRETDIKDAKLANAIFDSRTKWPDGFDQDQAMKAGARLVKPEAPAIAS